MPAMTVATSRDSPSMASPRITGVTPAARATSAAASREACGRAAMTVSALPSTASPGFGVSCAGSSRALATLSGGAMPYFFRTALASARLLVSATVGPEAITSGSSPGTSEMRKACSEAGAAAAASRPPLIAERCLRTAFISWIVVPLFSRARLTACLSSRLTPSAGSVSRAEPPPEISAITLSSAFRPETSSRMRRAASRPAASGTGWDASTTSIRVVGQPWP